MAVHSSSVRPDSKQRSRQINPAVVPLCWAPLPSILRLPVITPPKSLAMIEPLCALSGALCYFCASPLLEAYQEETGRGERLSVLPQSKSSGCGMKHEGITRLLNMYTSGTLRGEFILNGSLRLHT